MKRKSRAFTPAQSAELWERWKKGEGLASIARVLGKSHSSIFAHMSPSVESDRRREHDPGWR